VLRAFAEAGISIDVIAGTSSGSIIAALFAYGYSPAQLAEWAPDFSNDYLDVDYYALAKRLLSKRHKVTGLIKGKKLWDFIADKTNGGLLAELKIPAALTATDLYSGRRVLCLSRPLPGSVSSDTDCIYQMSIADAVLASISIPVVFQPVSYQNRLLVDGGLVENCPVSAVRLLNADVVIAVDLIKPVPEEKPFETLYSVLSRSVSIALYHQSRLHRPHADLTLQPEIGNVGVFEFSKLGDCMEAGYRCAQRQIGAVKELIASRRSARLTTHQPV
jgi:NTE family protein